MGALDAQGIWQYDETDSVSPFSAFMNRLGGSTSTQLAALRAKLAALDTAALSSSPSPSAFFTPASSRLVIQDNGTAIEVTGHMVVWEMRLNTTELALTAGAQVLTLGKVAAPYRPRAYFAPFTGWGGSPVLQGLCSAEDGGLSIRWSSAAGTPTHIVLGGAWPIP